LGIVDRSGTCDGTSLPDTTAPTTPGSFAVTWDDPWFHMSWADSTDSGGSGLAGYEVYLFNSYAEEIKISGEYPLPYTNFELDTRTEWNWQFFVGFRVYAVDYAGNRSTAAMDS
jgi:hypothetical protein